MITLVILGLFAFLWYQCEVECTFENPEKRYHKKAKTWGFKITPEE